MVDGGSPIRRLEFRRKDPELFVAIVAPVGADSEGVCSAIRSTLMTVGYQSKVLHLIDRVHDFSLEPAPHPEGNYYQQYDSHMTLGNEFRQVTEADDVFALLAASLVLRERRKSTGSNEIPVLATKGVRPRFAWIFRSFKREEEVQTLRDIYGEDGVVIVAAHASRETRISRLAQKIAGSDFSGPPFQFRDKAEHLVQRDEFELADPHGQRLRDAFPLADFFIDAGEPAEALIALQRFVDLLFDRAIITPTVSEYLMFHAQAAAHRSSSLARQVGAAIATAEGEIVAVGTNEVPKAGGGLYWGTERPDRRDFRLGFDPGTETKKRGLGQILESLLRDGWLSEETERKIREDPGGLQALVEHAWKLIRGTELAGVLEFGRTVHAEMAALMDAARRGVAVNGCTLYTTTFPCHMCARHIVAAGITRVVYRQPYPKSLATELHYDAIQPEPREVSANQVGFVPFIGIPPRRYIDLFGTGARTNGKPPLTHPSEAQPRLQGMPGASYVAHEVAAAGLLKTLTASVATDESAWLAEMAQAVH